MSLEAEIWNLRKGLRHQSWDVSLETKSGEGIADKEIYEIIDHRWFYKACCASVKTGAPANLVLVITVSETIAAGKSIQHVLIRPSARCRKLNSKRKIHIIKNTPCVLLFVKKQGQVGQ